MIGIYMITNIVNGKVYIGQSQHIELRWQQHRNRPFNSSYKEYDSYFYRAIRKYGLENFTFEVLEECNLDELDEKEIFWIKKRNSTNPNYGYNLTDGGTTAVTFSKITKNEVQEIKKLIKDTTLSYGEISRQFNVSERAIRMINEGETWIAQGEIYPLRPHKDKFQKKVCPYCGKNILNSSKTCVACMGKEWGKGCPISRQELKTLIRTKSFLKIGEDYGVSDNAVRKWCKKLNLPYQKKEIKNYSDEDWSNI